MFNIKHIFKTLVISGLLLSVTACSSNSSDAKRDCEKPLIVVTIPPLQYFAEQIGGDSIDIECLSPTTADPETFEPSMQQLRKATTAKALLSVGLLPFEEKLQATLKDSNPDMEITLLSDSLNLIKGTHGGEEMDPHIWTSIRNAKIMARHTFYTLSKISPNSIIYFQNRLKVVEQRLDSLDTAFCNQLSPLKGKAFIVWHPSLSYFARDYNLRQLSVGHENKESSLTGLKKHLAEFDKESPLLFFYQKEMDGRQSQTISDATGLTPTILTPMASDIEATLKSVTDALVSSSNSTAK